MCGIVGYVGGQQAAPIILKALEKLEGVVSTEVNKKGEGYANKM